MVTWICCSGESASSDVDCHHSNSVTLRKPSFSTRSLTPLGTMACGATPVRRFA